MPDAVTYDAPVVPTRPETKWEREHKAFLRLLPELLSTHRGRYVAIHDGRVVAEGDDRIQVALETYRKHGYHPIHVGLVTTEPEPVARIPSPRNVRNP